MLSWCGGAIRYVLDILDDADVAAVLEEAWR
jgi:hypothetical protein